MLLHPHPNKNMGKLLLIGLYLIAGSNGCKFEGLLSSCHMTVGGIGLQASARINHCRSPIDVTFQLQSSNQYNEQNENVGTFISWKYTYVTSNQPESLEIPGSGRRILMQISAESENRPNGEVRLPIQAHFLLDGQTTNELNFLDETVRIAHFDDCAYKDEEDQVGNIAMGCIIAVILLCLIGVASICGYHKHVKGRSDDEEGLVPNMERVQSGSNLFQTQPRSRENHENQADESNIKYVVPNQQDAMANGESHELQVYVSTSNGLQKVERQASNKSASISQNCPRTPIPSESGVDSPASLISSNSSNPTAAANSDNRNPSVVVNNSDNNSKESSDQESIISGTSSSVDHRALGAIPKSRISSPAASCHNQTDSVISSSSSSAVSR